MPLEQQRSVWSPDTDDGSPFSAARTVSSLHSRTTSISAQSDAPPVPNMPPGLGHHPKVGSVQLNGDDSCTPITLFEEYGSPVVTRKSMRAKGQPKSRATVGTRSGWWDHVRTPFTDQLSNPFAPKPQSPDAEAGAENDEWWKAVDEKKSAKSATNPGLVVSTTAANSVLRADESSPTIPSSSRSAPSHKAQSA